MFPAVAPELCSRQSTCQEFFLLAGQDPWVDLGRKSRRLAPGGTWVNGRASWWSIPAARRSRARSACSGCLIYLTLSPCWFPSLYGRAADARSVSFNLWAGLRSLRGVNGGRRAGGASAACWSSAVGAPTRSGTIQIYEISLGSARKVSRGDAVVNHNATRRPTTIRTWSCHV
jgi:hypothetical protein